jgi:DNA-binding protein HU-beta
MSAKKAAKKAAAKKEAPAKEIPAPAPAVDPEVPAAKEAPAKKVAKKAAKKEAAPKAEKSAPKPPKDVAKAAYLNYLNRKAKGLPGSQEGDWLAAEKSEGS